MLRRGVWKFLVWHSLCIGGATFPKIYPLWVCDVNSALSIILWVNNLGCLNNCFQSPGSSAHLIIHSLCALQISVRFSPVRILCYDFEGVFTRQYRPRFAFVFQIVALEYWCLGVSLSKGVFDKLIRAVNDWRQLAQTKRPVIRNYTIQLTRYSRYSTSYKEISVHDVTGL